MSQSSPFDLFGGETIFVIRPGTPTYNTLRVLYFLRGLGSQQLHRLFYAGMSDVQFRRQMKLLERHGFLKQAGRLYAGVDPKAKGKGQILWLLGPRGYKFLEEAEGFPSCPPKGADWWVQPIKSKGNHLFGLNSIYVRLVTEVPGLRPFEWVTYPRGHVYYSGRDGIYGAGKAYPDAEVSWESGGESRRLFLEYDRGTETLGRIREKITQLHDSVLKQVPDSVVIFACEGRIRAGNIGYLIRDRGLENRMTVCEAAQSHLLIGALIGEAEPLTGRQYQNSVKDPDWLGMLR